jgi:hypothetical protein
MEMLELHGRGTPEAFILAWIGWEGLKFRILVVALSMKGWKVSDIQDVFAHPGVHTNEHYRRLFKSIFGAFPNNIKGIGTQWGEAEKYRDLRNKYVHGAKSNHPEKFLSAIENLYSLTTEVEWLSNLSLEVNGEKRKIGNVYRRLAAPKKARSRASLEQLIKETR